MDVPRRQSSQTTLYTSHYKRYFHNHIIPTKIISRQKSLENNFFYVFSTLLYEGTRCTYKREQRKTPLTNATCFHSYSTISGDPSCILTSRKQLVLSLIHVEREKYSAVVTHPMAASIT